MDSSEEQVVEIDGAWLHRIKSWSLQKDRPLLIFWVVLAIVGSLYAYQYGWQMVVVVLFSMTIAGGISWGMIQGMKNPPIASSGYEHGVYDSKAEVWNVEEWTSAGGHRKYQVPEKNPPLGD